MTKAIMIQGTGSNVGKSMLVAGLCRHFTNQGIKVRPFKPQNMSNNAAVTSDGGEIGRAQALQAIACKTDPTTLMNPVLLKPEGETGSQVIVKGKRLGSYKAKDFYKLKKTLLPEVLSAFQNLKQQADLIIVEGAGSASEINLRQNDIANMGFALATNTPVILAADIDRGGVIASIVGTHALLPQEELNLIKGFIINKFRGDPNLFQDALTLITSKTSWACLGICPWFPKAHLLPAEDSQDLETSPVSRKNNSQKLIRIAVPVLPRISNFDDLDPLRAEPNVELNLIKPGTPIPATTDLIILTGSKATISDLKALYTEGWDIDIKAHIRRGGYVLGLCGGYQMLGNKIVDPNRIESELTSIKGLACLDIETSIETTKTLEKTTATDLHSSPSFNAYQMHMGTTTGEDCTRPLFKIGDEFEGALSTNGRVMGTYLHGLFQSDKFRESFLKRINTKHRSTGNYQNSIETTLDQLAEHLEQNLDLKTLLQIAK